MQAPVDRLGELVATQGPLREGGVRQRTDLEPEDYQGRGHLTSLGTRRRGARPARVGDKTDCETAAEWGERGESLDGEQGKHWNLLDAVSGAGRTAGKAWPQRAVLPVQAWPRCRLLPGGHRTRTRSAQRSLLAIQKAQRKQQPVWLLGADLSQSTDTGMQRCVRVGLQMGDP